MVGMTTDLRHTDQPGDHYEEFWPPPRPDAWQMDDPVPYRLLSRLLLAALVVVAAWFALRWFLADDEYVAPVEIVQTAPTALREFTPNPQTCFGDVAQRIELEATRDNSVPIPLFPDIPWTDDRYGVGVTVRAEMCVSGLTAVTPAEDGTYEVIVDQRRNLYLNRPAIDAVPCDTDPNEDCLEIWGHPSNGSMIVSLLPFTNGGDNNLVAAALETAQVIGTAPDCLEAAMAQPGLGLYAMLEASIARQAADQGITSPIRLTLLDASGAPTDAWDARPQRARHTEALARLTRALPENVTVTPVGECDITGWGIAS